MTWKNETTRQPLPAPLPMYEPVRLKHVPTIVRRRYDRDLKTFKNPYEGLPSEEGKSDGDGVEDNDDSTIVGDVGDSVDDNEVEDDTDAIFYTDEHDDTESNMENFGSINIESSSITYEGDNKIKKDKDQDAIDTSSDVDSNVEDNDRDQSWQSNASSGMNDHGSYSKDCDDEDNGAKDVDFVSFVDDNEQGSNSIDQKYEVDKPEDVTPIDYEQDNEIDDDGTKDGIIASWYDNGNVQDDVQGDGEHGNFEQERQDLPEEDDKSEGDEAEVVIHDASGGLDLDDSVNFEVEDDDEQANNLDTKLDTNQDTIVNNGAKNIEQDNNIINNDGIVASCYKNGSDQDKGEDDEHGNFDKEQAFSKEDDRSKGNRVEDVIHDAMILDLASSVNHEVEDDAQAKFDTKHDPKSYTTTTEYFDTNNLLEETNFEGEIQQRDGGGASSEETSREASVEDSIKDHGHENSDIKHQDFLVLDSKKIEDGTVANNIVDESFKLEAIKEKQHEDLDIKQDFPEASMKTLESEGYELYCPNCNHIITRTMIIRRRVDYEESRTTTCFTFLTSLFCCSQW